MTRSSKLKCTAVTTGVIIKRYIQPQRSDSIIVEYEVEGEKYQIAEVVAMKRLETLKLGPVPIGYRMEPILKDIDEGATIRVFYNPDKPNKAFLPDNSRGITVY